MTPTASTSLDLDRLEKVRRCPGGIEARCPACAEEGHDRTGNNLFHNPDTGAFYCHADPGHTRRIRELVGIRRDLDPAERERRRQEFIREKREEREREGRRRAAQNALPELVRKWRWDPADLWEDSPIHPEEAADDPRFFLASLFDLEALIWTGHLRDSGDQRHADRWKTVWHCLHEPAENIGPMVTPSTWKPGTISRKRENVATAPYVILDFDGPKQWKPRDQADLDRHIAESLAIVRYLKEDRQWNLAAIVYTGNKSIHAWFDHPGDGNLEKMKPTLEVLGIDPSLIGHPEHPARLPGQVNDKSGKMSRVLWLRYNGNP